MMPRVYTVHTLWLTQSYMLEQKYNVDKLIKLLGKINTVHQPIREICYSIACQIIKF